MANANQENYNDLKSNYVPYQPQFTSTAPFSIGNNFHSKYNYYGEYRHERELPF